MKVVEREKAQEPGYGIDRTVIRQLLGLTPAERFRRAVRSARNVATMLAKINLRDR